MSLEDKIAALIVALDANTAAHAGSGASSAATTPAKGATKPTGATKPKNTRAAMQAALSEVKEKIGAPEAKEIIKAHGGVDKMADIPDAKIDACYDAAKAKLAEAEAGNEGGGDDGI